MTSSPTGYALDSAETAAEPMDGPWTKYASPSDKICYDKVLKGPRQTNVAIIFIGYCSAFRWS
jgi:hypothetical protein